MTDLEISVLRILRVFGPCSNSEVSRRLGVPGHKTYLAVYALTQRGLAVHPKLQRWHISRLGLEWFAKNGLNEIALFKGN